MVFTGHSLGGGAALCAHLSALSLDDSSFLNVNVRSIVFSAPKVFYTAGTMSDKEQRAIKAMKESSCNFVCDSDVVPHLPGDTDLYKEALKMAIDATLTHLAVKDDAGLTNKMHEFLLQQKNIDATAKEKLSFCSFTLAYSYS